MSVVVAVAVAAARPALAVTMPLTRSAMTGLALTGTLTLLFDAPLPVFVAVEPRYHNVTMRDEGPGADGVEPRPDAVVVMAVEVLWVIEVPHDRDTRVIRVLVHHIRRGEFDRQALRPLKF